MVKHIIIFYSDIRKPSKKQVAVAEFVLKHKKLLTSQNINITAITITPDMLKDDRIKEMMKRRSIKALPVLITPKRNYYEREGEKVTILTYYKSVINVIESEMVEQQRQMQPEPEAPRVDVDGDEVAQYYTSMMMKRREDDGDSDDSDDGASGAANMDKVMKRMTAAAKHRERTMNIKNRKHSTSSKDRKRRDTDEHEDNDENERQQTFNNRHGEQGDEPEGDSMAREDNVGGVSKYLDGLDDNNGDAEEYARSELSKSKGVKVDVDEDTKMLEKLGML